MVPVDSFSDGAELIRSLADERKYRRRLRAAPTQEALARTMHRSKAFVARIETETLGQSPRNPTMKTVCAHAAALGYDVRLVVIPRE
jgi:transcriptional regulator with XRE-family HTH domain